MCEKLSRKLIDTKYEKNSTYFSTIDVVFSFSAINGYNFRSGKWFAFWFVDSFSHKKSDEYISINDWSQCVILALLFSCCIFQSAKGSRARGQTRDSFFTFSPLRWTTRKNSAETSLWFICKTKKKRKESDQESFLYLFVLSYSSFWF